uniref:Cytoplasmic tRNA 2-thiolation protein 2 n=1 Tax=Macaca mulatta TaxID=9544 RepID=A0A5F8AJ46_MACMU
MPSAGTVSRPSTSTSSEPCWARTGSSFQARRSSWRGLGGLRPAPWSGRSLSRCTNQKLCPECVCAAHLTSFRLLNRRRNAGLSQDSAKRLRFVPGVIFVDEGAAFGKSLEERSKTLAEVKPILQATGLPWHVVALEEVFSLPPSVLRCSAQEPAGSEGAYKAAVDSFLQQQHVLGAGGGPGPTQGKEQPPQPRLDPQSLASPPAAAQPEALSQLFCSVRTLTAKEELLQTLRTHLILHMARAHGYSKVMTGDSCTRLAIKLMTNLALGRGAFLAWDTGFSDERHGDVVVVRPMRDHTLKEVAFYNRLFSVPSVFTPAVDTKAPEKASIHRLMEAFILRLQTQFPSTVSTVYRTSEKLVKAPRDGPAAGDSSPCCLLCMCALDVDAADSATAFGAQTSRLSQMQSPTPLTETRTPPGPCCSPGVGRVQGCGQGACRREDPQACIEEQLCYSCRMNMKDLVSACPPAPGQAWGRGKAVPSRGCWQILWPLDTGLCCSPHWTPCRRTSWPRPSSAHRGTEAPTAVACGAGASGLVPTAAFSLGPGSCRRSGTV